MLKIKQAIIVEGKYDKIKLDSLVDALIIATDGFSIFKSKSKLDFIKNIAEEKGIIIFTDSDSAGFKIRSYLKGCIDDKYVRNAYIPDVYGKEKRKRKAGKEGKIGVEGVDKELILNALKEAGASFEADDTKEKITTADLFELGINGKEHSADKKKKLCKKLGLPEGISKTAMLKVLNFRFDHDEFYKLYKELSSED